MYDIYYKLQRTSFSILLKRLCHKQNELLYSIESDSVTPQTVTCQVPMSMGFSRQEYWSGLEFPPSGDLPDPGIKPASPALAGEFFTTKPLGKPVNKIRTSKRCLPTNPKNLMLVYILYK